MSRTAILSGLSGIVGTAVDVVTLALLLELGVPVAVAAALGALAGAGLCFVANKYVAFRDDASLSVRQVGAFGLVAVGTALLMAIAMHATVVGLGIAVLPAKAVCGAVLFFAWSLPAQRRFVFASPGSAGARSTASAVRSTIAAPPPLQLERDPATSYA